MTADIIWQDPPPDGRMRNGGRVMDPRRAAMDSNPGRWLVWSQHLVSAGADARLRKLGYEVARRGNVVYARRPEGRQQ